MSQVNYCLIMLVNITQVPEACHIASKGSVRKTAKQQSVPHLEELVPTKSTDLRLGSSGTLITVS